MKAEILTTNPEKKELLDDNALKFTLAGLDTEFLQQKEANSFLLITDWLEMGESSERKLAYKKYDDGRVEMLLIQKYTDANGNRTVPPKEKLSHQQYSELLEQSVLRVEKMRHEFNYAQGDTNFSMKYDEFAGSELRVLEVDTDNETARNSFDSTQFPCDLANVTGQIEYYGFRVAQQI